MPCQPLFLIFFIGRNFLLDIIVTISLLLYICILYAYMNGCHQKHYRSNILMIYKYIVSSSSSVSYLLYTALHILQYDCMYIRNVCISFTLHIEYYANLCVIKAYLFIFFGGFFQSCLIKLRHILQHFQNKQYTYIETNTYLLSAPTSILLTPRKKYRYYRIPIMLFSYYKKCF